jgi:hypothetical protein
MKKAYQIYERRAIAPPELAINTGVKLAPA